MIGVNSIDTATKKGKSMNTAEFELRLERLERRVNRYRLASILLGLALVAVAGIAATAPVAVSPEVRTRKILVVNDTGKEVVRMFAGPHGGVLDILNNDDKPTVRAGSWEKGGKVTLSDGTGNVYMELVSDDVGGQFTLSDKKGAKNLIKAAK
jgi:hypothetical protein